jgi:multidrug efflux pump subunit AcrB
MMKHSLRKSLNISRLAINHPWLTISFWIAVTVAGLLAFSSLKYALFPDVTFPVVIVKATSPIENTLETETKLTDPLETPLLSLENIAEVYASTFPGQTVINALFMTGETLTSSLEKVKTALQEVSLPPETSVQVIPFNLNESTAISYAITSKSKTLTELQQITREKIIPSLEKNPSILQVNLLGSTAKSEDKANIRGENLATLVEFNGESSLAIQVVKKSKANTLDVVDKVQKNLSQLIPQLPDIEISLAQTEAGYIKEATQATIDSLILAIILAILVIFPFLPNLYATLITALAIPMSLLGTCIVMAIAGFNLETITLLALALVIGIVVDDAIVDVENIARHIAQGETPKQAAIAGTDEIGLTVSASTLSIVAVFLPVALMGGTLGQFFKPFGLTVCTAVIISLLVARTLSPVLAMYWLKSNSKQTSLKIPFLTSFGTSVIRRYRSLLGWSLEHRKIVVFFALLSFIAGVALIPLIPKGFIPQLDRGEFNIIYTTDLPKLPSGWKLKSPSESPSPSPSPTSSTFDWLGTISEDPNAFIIRRTRRIGTKLEKVVLESPEVESVFTVVGFREQPNKGKIYVKLKEDRNLTTAQLQAQIRASLPPIKGTDISVEDIKFVETGDEKPFKIAFLGDDLKILTQTAQKVKTRLEEFPSLVDLSTSVSLADNQQETDIFMIEHKRGQRVAFISANLAEGEALGNVTDRVVKVIKPMLPPEVQLQLEGDSMRLGEVLADFRVTLLLSVALMLLVLLLFFGRVLEPLVVALSLPLSIVGAMLGLLITRSEFGMISLIGLIFLLGLLDKNALLLVDYATQLRHRGMRRREAILETGTVRLRPILMTTCSTILGMLPIALGWGAGAELRQPMAVAIIGGLLTSSILSLIFVPVFYTLLEDLWLKICPKT